MVGGVGDQYEWVGGGGGGGGMSGSMRRYRWVGVVEDFGDQYEEIEVGGGVSGGGCWRPV